MDRRRQAILIRLFSLLFPILLFSRTGALSVVPRSICEIQGAGFSSPYLGEQVVVQGVVYADLDETSSRGFFIQSQGCDSQPETSDGIFVYIQERVNVVSSGDLVEVYGSVNEYYGLTEIFTSPEDVFLLSSGNPLPDAISLNPPAGNEAARNYFESLESMYVMLEDGLVVGPTDKDDRSWLVDKDSGIDRVYWDDPQGTGVLVCVDDRSLYEITPEVKTGDEVFNLYGPLEYHYKQYCLQPLVPPEVVTNTFQLNPTFSAELSVVTFNLENLFDTLDDPLTEDTVLGPTEYQRKLSKRALAIHDYLGEPDILAVQEVENITVTLDLVNQPEITAPYDIFLEDGPDIRGLDVALIYRTDRVQVITAEYRQGCTTLVDGLGPDGNHDMGAPANAITCDSDGDTVLDGNRLFSRPPLMTQVRFCPQGCVLSAVNAGAGGETRALWLVITHFKSKVQDTDEVAYTLPRRLEQAQYVATLVDEILSLDPEAKIIVLGDMNDHPDSQPLAVLELSALQNMIWRLPRETRYTYIYHGISQVLDHILLNAHAGFFPSHVSVAHINADFPYALRIEGDSPHRSSDHDPVVVYITWFDVFVHFPILWR